LTLPGSVPLSYAPCRRAPRYLPLPAMDYAGIPRRNFTFRYYYGILPSCNTVPPSATCATACHTGWGHRGSAHHLGSTTSLDLPAHLFIVQENLLLPPAHTLRAWMLGLAVPAYYIMILTKHGFSACHTGSWEVLHWGSLASFSSAAYKFTYFPLPHCLLYWISCHYSSLACWVSCISPLHCTVPPDLLGGLWDYGMHGACLIGDSPTIGGL